MVHQTLQDLNEALRTCNSPVVLTQLYHQRRALLSIFEELEKAVDDAMSHAAFVAAR